MNTPRILLVDDEPNLSGLVRLILEKNQRFDVLEENRPSRAHATARAFQPDLILMDVDMPGKDGGEVAREIQSDPTLQGVPIIFCTSLVSRAETGGDVVQRGGKLFLAKPADPKKLISALDRILDLPVETT